MWLCLYVCVLTTVQFINAKRAVYFSITLKIDAAVVNVYQERIFIHITRNVIIINPTITFMGIVTWYFHQPRAKAICCWGRVSRIQCGQVECDIIVNSIDLI